MRVLLHLIEESDADAVVVDNRDLKGVRALRSVGRALSRQACDVIIADTTDQRAARPVRQEAEDNERAPAL